MTHATHRMHEHSLEAFELERPKLGSRAAAIFYWLRDHDRPRGYTDREIKDAWGFDDMNSIRPRVTELVGMGLLIECGKRRCIETGKTVRRVRCRQSNNPEQLQLAGLRK